MKDPFFEEYELKLSARIAAPMLRHTGNLSQELFEIVQEALQRRRDILVAVTSLTLEPVEQGKTK